MIDEKKTFVFYNHSRQREEIIWALTEKKAYEILKKKYGTNEGWVLYGAQG